MGVGRRCSWGIDLSVRCFELEDASKSKRSLAVKLKGVAGGLILAVSNVYGPNDDSQRSDFLKTIPDSKSLWSVPWCIGGDFNMVRFPYEKKGSRNLTYSTERFEDFINNNELIDLPSVHRNYTWSNNQERQEQDRSFPNFKGMR
eukprot:TRINITY_DN17396_c0_g2_i1.p1 TRINITY_DN17396_c0_g2~~TRINITY_DN17396_c0_g2_i1.p1  ORF type:complete len:145 (-),score=23.46 TRINITY_DN17396_c0_g2_i1:183-617(-)